MSNREASIEESMTDEADSEKTPIIDSEGNLFGIINVIDALVILLVIAVVLGGLAVVGVLGSDDPNGEDGSTETNESSLNNNDLETQYATVDAGSHPRFVVDRISEGDTVTQDGRNTTITDIYVTPTSATSSSVLLGVELETETDSPSRTGDSVDIDTGEYDIDGEILRTEDSPPAVEIEPMTVDLRIDDVDEDTAEAIRKEATAATQELSLVTISEVTTQSTTGSQSTTESAESSKSTLRLTAELGTVQTAGGPQFHSTPIRVGNTIEVDLGTVEIEGTISNIHSE